MDARGRCTGSEGSQAKMSGPCPERCGDCERCWAAGDAAATATRIVRAALERLARTTDGATVLQLRELDALDDALVTLRRAYGLPREWDLVTAAGYDAEHRAYILARPEPPLCLECRTAEAEDDGLCPVCRELHDDGEEVAS